MRNSQVSAFPWTFAANVLNGSSGSWLIDISSERMTPSATGTTAIDLRRDRAFLMFKDAKSGWARNTMSPRQSSVHSSSCMASLAAVI